MLTFFTTLKPMIGPAAVAQANAVRSWQTVAGAQVIVLAGGQGVARACAEWGVEHVPQVPCNAFGTPTLSGLLDVAQALGRHRVLCYVNADIVLLPDFAAAVREMMRVKRQFLMVGRRTDVAGLGAMHFASGWDADLSEKATRTGQLCPATAIDYFVFPKAALGDVPPFAIGRTAWDNWLIYRARQRCLPVVDATARVLAVHQAHDYEHTDQAQAGRGRKWVWQGPEARQNLAMAGGKANLYTLFDATHRLTGRGVERADVQGRLGGGVWSYRRSAAWRAA